MKPWMWAVIAGVVVGVVYTLSPLTTLFLAAIVPLCRWAGKGLPAEERRWLTIVLGLAIALRLAAIAGLFLSADGDIPFANFFSDEEFFKRRAIWLRNVGMGIPISTADFIYTFDETGDSSYLYLLAYVQALVGFAPYGVHVLNAAMYLAAAVALFRLVRPSFGAGASIGALTLLLFLPSLFVWSISALKEPPYFLVAAVNVVAVISIVRAHDWRMRVAAAAILVLGGLALQSLREGGLMLTAIGAGSGLAAWRFVLLKPRAMLATVGLLVVVSTAALTRPQVQERLWPIVHQAAFKHWGHINTPGLTYRLLDDRFYADRNLVPTMTAAEAARFMIRAAWSYATVPLPWRIESRSMLAQWPEHALWYGLLILLPAGVIAGLRRDPLLTSVLLAHGLAAALIVAVSGGNIGTLVRHRGLALPYLLWLSCLGAIHLGSYVVSQASGRPAGTRVSHSGAKGSLAC